MEPKTNKFDPTKFLEGKAIYHLPMLDELYMEAFHKEGNQGLFCVGWEEGCNRLGQHTIERWIRMCDQAQEIVMYSETMLRQPIDESTFNVIGGIVEAVKNTAEIAKSCIKVIIDPHTTKGQRYKASHKLKGMSYIMDSLHDSCKSFGISVDLL